jgi:hypothetical protein
MSSRCSKQRSHSARYFAYSPSSVAAANDKTTETPAPKTEAGAARSEGLRLYKLAGRPTKAQFIRVFGKDGAKWTWEQRAKHAELASAEAAAKKFQSMLAARVGK